MNRLAVKGFMRRITQANQSINRGRGLARATIKENRKADGREAMRELADLLQHSLEKRELIQRSSIDASAILEYARTSGIDLEHGQEYSVDYDDDDFDDEYDDYDDEADGDEDVSEGHEYRLQQVDRDRLVYVPVDMPVLQMPAQRLINVDNLDRNEVSNSERTSSESWESVDDHNQQSEEMHDYYEGHSDNTESHLEGHETEKGRSVEVMSEYYDDDLYRMSFKSRDDEEDFLEIELHSINELEEQYDEYSNYLLEEQYYSNPYSEPEDESPSKSNSQYGEEPSEEQCQQYPNETSREWLTIRESSEDMELMNAFQVLVQDQENAESNEHGDEQEGEDIDENDGWVDEHDEVEGFIEEFIEDEGSVEYEEEVYPYIPYNRWRVGSSNPKNSQVSQDVQLSECHISDSFHSENDHEKEESDSNSQSGGDNSSQQPGSSGQGSISNSDYQSEKSDQPYSENSRASR